MTDQAPSLREYSLVVLNEDAPQGEFRLDGSVAAVGRDGESDVCLSWDPLVSRRHARLRVENGALVLEDMGSTNGTYVGDHRVTGPVVVWPGHTLRVGRTLLELRSAEVPPPPEPEQPPPAESPDLPPTAEPALPDAPSSPHRPGILNRTLSALRLRGAPQEAPDEVPQEPLTGVEADGPERPAGPPSSHVSATIFPLWVEVRARRPAGDGPGVADDLRAALAGLEPNEHTVAKIVEPLHKGEAWVSMSASPGHEADLLALAGHVIDRLLYAGIHGTVTSGRNA